MQTVLLFSYSPVTHMGESCHAYECAMLHISIISQWGCAWDRVCLCVWMSEWMTPSCVWCHSFMCVLWPTRHAIWDLIIPHCFTQTRNIHIPFFVHSTPVTASACKCETNSIFPSYYTHHDDRFTSHIWVRSSSCVSEGERKCVRRMSRPQIAWRVNLITHTYKGGTPHIWGSHGIKALL